MDSCEAMEMVEKLNQEFSDLQDKIISDNNIQTKYNLLLSKWLGKNKDCKRTKKELIIMGRDVGINLDNKLNRGQMIKILTDDPNNTYAHFIRDMEYLYCNECDKWNVRASMFSNNQCNKCK